MKDVKYLIGCQEMKMRPLPPYSEMACSFCYRLSQELLASQASRAYPDIVALAFWCRKSNILRLKAKFESEEVRIGRGLAFHVTPANVPVNFAFSFLFSLLAGNSNIVRIPSKYFPQTEIICSAIDLVLKEEAFSDLRDGTAFISYPSSDSQTTAAFSAMADMRLIWGGDNTIDTIRSMPSKPRCIDMCFADRYSIAIVDGQAVIDSDDSLLVQQAEKFYNDTYLMDQNACSSPQIIFWRNGSKQAKERFWNAIVQQAQQRYLLQDAAAVDKYTQLCQDAIELSNFGECRLAGNILTVVSLDRLPKHLTKLRGCCGYFYEFDLETLSQLADHINERYQTITYFGIDPEEIRNFVIQSRLSGVDRIVPFGSAMDIGVVWDGYDVIRSLSRIVALV